MSYPTEEALRAIKEWDRFDDQRGWFALIKASGNYWPDDSWGWSERDEEDEIVHDFVHVYEISTGGWSGNEEILGAMRANNLMWTLTWQISRRGGHYTFHVKHTARDRHDVKEP